MAESTPLLVDVDVNTSPIEHVPASGHFRRVIKRLTRVILVISVLDFLLVFADYLAVTTGPLRGYLGTVHLCILILGPSVRTDFPSALHHLPTFHQIIPFNIK